MQVVCSLKCAAEHGKKDLIRQQRREKTEGRKRLMTRSDWIKKAQVAVNRYVRARDFGKPCISCGGMPAQKFGGTIDAGHFRSVGSAPNLRFYTLQIAGQCVKCNRYLSSNTVEYRRGLIARIGAQKVEQIEMMQRPGKWPVAYLERLTGVMNKKARRLEKKYGRKN